MSAEGVCSVFARFIKKVAPYRQLYLFLLLPVIYIIIFAYWPMFGLQIAFKKFSIVKGIWGSPWVGLKKFTKFINAYQFRNILLNIAIRYTTRSWARPSTCA